MRPLDNFKDTATGVNLSMEAKLLFVSPRYQVAA
jgi:hypothetical protein